MIYLAVVVVVVVVVGGRQIAVKISIVSLRGIPNPGEPGIVTVCNVAFIAFLSWIFANKICIIMAKIYYNVHVLKYTGSYRYLQAFILIYTTNRKQI